jgi:hypothetical protein
MMTDIEFAEAVQGIGPVLPGLTPEQHAERVTAVGASEVHDALFRPAQLWLRKTGRELVDDSPLLRLGNAIEPYILGEYALATGRTVVPKPDTVRDGRMVAHLDALSHFANDEPAAVECKWRGSRDGWGEELTADIPMPVLLQVQQQMGLARLQWAHVPVLFLRPPIVQYRVAFDAALFDMLRAGVDRFWHYVETDTPPPVDAAAPEAVEVLRKLYPGTDGTRIVATRDLEHWRTVCQESSSKAKSYEQVADTAKAHLLASMKNAAELEFADGTVFRRAIVKRKGYTVESTEYMATKFIKPKE